MRGVVIAGVAAIAIALTTGACGTSQVITNVPGSRVYVDGRALGPEREFRQRGLPGNALVLVKTPDGRRKMMRVKRRFTATTAVLGLVSWVGWFTFWEYPDVVYVEFDEPAAPRGGGWDEAPGGGGDPWQTPPAGWQEPAPPAPAAGAAGQPPPAEPAAPTPTDPSDPWQQAPPGESQ